MNRSLFIAAGAVAVALLAAPSAYALNMGTGGGGLGGPLTMRGALSCTVKSPGTYYSLSCRLSPALYGHYHGNAPSVVSVSALLSANPGLKGKGPGSHVTCDVVRAVPGNCR